MMTTTPTTVAVLGAGIMGRGIARVFAAAGIAVHLRDIDEEAIERARRTLRRDLDRTVARGHLSEEDRDALLGRITWTTSLADAVGSTELVVEAAPEDLELKRSIFAELDQLAPPDAVLATNTSALSVTSIASAVEHPERVVGLHFFNPVHRMELVEVVIGTATDSATTERSLAACAAIGKTTIEVADRPGFATSRVNAMIGNEAFTMLMEGVASAEAIDTGMKLALNHPMGPFELVDLVGLDTRLSVLRRLHEGLGERFRPSPLLVSLVEAGRLGRKTGHGVYRYDADGNRIPGSATIGDRPGSTA
jgi:3-hydroxybutyryl-CoA dehydrogenase